VPVIKRDLYIVGSVFTIFIALMAVVIWLGPMRGLKTRTYSFDYYPKHWPGRDVALRYAYSTLEGAGYTTTTVRLNSSGVNTLVAPDRWRFGFETSDTRSWNQTWVDVDVEFDCKVKTKLYHPK
jgi:hypothetical protein